MGGQRKGTKAQGEGTGRGVQSSQVGPDTALRTTSRPQMSTQQLPDWIQGGEKLAGALQGAAGRETYVNYLIIQSRWGVKTPPREQRRLCRAKCKTGFREYRRGFWDINNVNLNFYQVLSPSCCTCAEGSLGRNTLPSQQRSWTQDSSSGIEDPALALREGANSTTLVTSNQTVLGRDASRQLAREEAQNNSDSWGEGVPWAQALAAKSSHLEPHPGSTGGGLVTLGESLLPESWVCDPNLDPTMEQPVRLGKGLYLQLDSATPEENRMGCLPGERERWIPLCPEAGTRASPGGLVGRGSSEAAQRPPPAATPSNNHNHKEGQLKVWEEDLLKALNPPTHPFQQAPLSF